MTATSLHDTGPAMPADQRPACCRKRAAEIRTLAADLKTDPMRRQLLALAQTWEETGHSVEEALSREAETAHGYLFG